MTDYRTPAHKPPGLGPLVAWSAICAVTAWLFVRTLRPGRRLP